MLNPAAIQLSQLKKQLTKRTVKELAESSHVQAGLEDMIGRFYESLIQACETGTVNWVDPILDTWLSAMPRDLSAESTLLPMVSTIKRTLWRVCEFDDEEQAFNTIQAVEAVFEHSLMYINKLETSSMLSQSERNFNEFKATMLELDKSKASFVAVAAHELKTPLTLVQGYSNMLTNELLEVESKTKYEPYLRGINNGTARLKEILDAMLDVTLIDNGLLELSYQPVWLSQLIEGMLAELEEQLETRELDIVYEPFLDPKEFFYADPERLQQIIRNVVLNAIKYTPDGGKVTINGRKLPGFIDIAVEDTGIGIALDKQQTIFEKFIQTGDVARHSSGKVKFKGGGPGLGLVIAKGLIEAHEGTIWCQSDGYDEETCPGSVFHIMVPFRETPPDELSAQIFGDSTGPK